MKVLLGHDYYRSSAPSGEDAVFRNERSLLESRGVEVIPFERFNDHIDDTTVTSRLKVARNGVWSRQTYEELSQLIRKTKPDIAHFHNTFPLISPSAYAACQDNGVPVVQTLHNYRLICAAALLQRNGRPCEDCVGATLLPALWHRCYRGSLPATSALVWMLASNRRRGVYRSLVDRYIALSNFAAGRLVAGGLPKDRMIVKPNFLPEIPLAGDGDGGYAVYVGRLSDEKGVKTLLTAWKQMAGFPLKVLGDGPLRAELEKMAEEEGIEAEFLGFCPHNKILEVVKKAEFQIIPSEWYEGFPMVLLEAYGCGTPVVASRIGSLDELVEEGVTGLKFVAGDPADLAEKVKMMRADRNKLDTYRHGARTLFEEKYTANRNFAMLMDIYNDVIYRTKDKGRNER